MGRFNSYLMAFICCLPLGLIFLIAGYIWLDGGGTYTSGMSMIVLGILILAIAGISLIVGLIKYGRQPY